MGSACCPQGRTSLRGALASDVRNQSEGRFPTGRPGGPRLCPQRPLPLSSGRGPPGPGVSLEPRPLPRPELRKACYQGLSPRERVAPAWAQRCVLAGHLGGPPELTPRARAPEEVLAVAAAQGASGESATQARPLPRTLVTGEGSVGQGPGVLPELPDRLLGSGPERGSHQPGLVPAVGGQIRPRAPPSQLPHATPPPWPPPHPLPARASQAPAHLSRAPLPPGPLWPLHSGHLPPWGTGVPSNSSSRTMMGPRAGQEARCGVGGPGRPEHHSAPQVSACPRRGPSSAPAAASGNC